MTKNRVAIVGTGIAGLGCGYFLAPHAEITLFEQASHIGGHSNTIDVTTATGHLQPIDTGFMVYNETTYPNLTRLFKALDVPVEKTEMSFSVHHGPAGLEWCGSGLNHLFAQRRNLFRLRYWRFLMQLDRFNREAPDALTDARWETVTIQDYVDERGYGDDFLQWFLVPMSAAIWSTSPQRMLQFPARTLLRFFSTHGFLGMKDHLPWKTVVGGAKAYVQKLTAPWSDRIYLNQAVRKVVRHETGVTLYFADGGHADFDKVILACHADEALAMLESPTDLEADVLGRFAYETNTALLHTDTSVMPKRRLCWASWNYTVEADSQSHLGRAATHYWMNNLQHIPAPTQYFVSINAPKDALDLAKVLKQIAYTHPIFSVEAIAAQAERLPALNYQHAEQRVYFCGSYFKYGFHEDAFTSALTLCQKLIGSSIWP